MSIKLDMADSELVDANSIMRMFEKLNSRFDESKLQMDEIGRRLTVVEQRPRSRSSSVNSAEATLHSLKHDVKRSSGAGVSLVENSLSASVLERETQHVETRAARTFEIQIDETLNDEELRAKPPTYKHKSRQSTLERDVEEMKFHRLKSAVNVYHEQPSYAHIKLERATLRAFDVFLYQVYNYETLHGITLSIPPLISNKVRKLLVSHARDENMQINDIMFYTLDLADITTLMRMYCKPCDKQDFYFKLNSNLKFIDLPPEYKASILNFLPMFEAICMFKEDYLRVYEFLKVNNERNVPQCNSKEGGLLTIVLDKVPFGYIKGVLQALGKFQFKDVDEMWTQIFHQVNEDKKNGRIARQTQFRMTSIKENAHQARSTSSKPPLKLSFIEEQDTISEGEDQDGYGRAREAMLVSAELDFASEIGESDEEINHVAAVSAFAPRPKE